MADQSALCATCFVITGGWQSTAWRTETSIWTERSLCFGHPAWLWQPTAMKACANPIMVFSPVSTKANRPKSLHKGWSFKDRTDQPRIRVTTPIVLWVRCGQYSKSTSYHNAIYIQVGTISDLQSFGDCRIRCNVKRRYGFFSLTFD